MPVISEVLPSISCAGISVGRTRQFVTSEQILKANCISQLGADSRHIEFRAEPNLNIELTFTQIDDEVALNNTEEQMYIVDDLQNQTPVDLSRGQSEVDVVIKSNTASLTLPNDDKRIISLISFQGEHQPCISRSNMLYF